MLLFEALSFKFGELKLRKNSHCPMCGNPPKTANSSTTTSLGTDGEEEPETDLHVSEITARELKERLDNDEEVFLLDVREPHEYQICNLKGHLIPLGELPRRVHELDSAQQIVVHCKTGKRSAQAVDFLRQAGLPQGVQPARWNPLLVSEVDHSFPRY